MPILNVDMIQILVMDQLNRFDVLKLVIAIEMSILRSVLNGLLENIHKTLPARKLCLQIVLNSHEKLFLHL